MEAWVIKNDKGEYLSNLSENTFTNNLLLASIFIHKSKANFILALNDLKQCNLIKVEIREVEEW